MWRAEGLPCNKYFRNSEHKFNEPAKFMIIEKINNASLPKQKRRSILEQREYSWIITLDTLSPTGLNKSLSHPQGKTDSIW